MKTIALSKGQVAIVDDEDFEWLTAMKWAALQVKRKRGIVFYAFRHPKWKGPIHYMHRDIGERMGFIGVQMDHRDGNGLNNQRCNLRPATSSQNNANKKKVEGKSRFKGVFWRQNGGTWYAQIRHNGKLDCLGTYKTEEDAARAYDVAATTHFGEFAFLNFP